MSNLDFFVFLDFIIVHYNFALKSLTKNARLLNDMKDIVDVDVEKINLDVSLPLDELDAPYLLYFNENCELSKFFVFEKGNGECSYSFLDSLNVKK